MANTMQMDRSGIFGKDKTLLNRMPLPYNMVFQGDSGERYEILHDSMVDIGGQALVYRARKLSTGEIVAAKVYDQFRLDPIGKANRQKIVEFVRKYAGYESCMMPLKDTGYMLVPGIDGGQYERPVDVLPLCESSLSGKKLSYHTLRNEFIPKMGKAIHLLHQHSLVHRDIKPENVYMHTGSYVLGDYGTLQEVDEELGYKGTRLRRGTLGYAPPEIIQAYVRKESDWFSFGMTIASLYHGKHVYQDLIDAGDEAGFFHALDENGIPLNLENGHEDLQTLVDALTMLKPSERAGYEDILLWLKNPKEFARKFKGNKNHGERGFPFNFEGTELQNKKQLVDAFITHWNTATGYLYRGGERNSSVVNLFSMNDPSISNKLCQIIETGKTATNHDLGMAQALYYIDNNTPYVWRGKKFQSLLEISRAIEKNEIDTEFTQSMFSSGYISWRSSVAEGNLNIVKGMELIQHIEEQAGKYPVFAHYYAMYVFTSDKNTRQYRGVRALNNVFAQFIQNNSDFYRDRREFVYEEKLHAFLAAEGFYANVLAYKNSLSGKNFIGDMELAYRLWESICTDKSAVRIHYINMGPQSWLSWVQRNLSMYRFNTVEAKQLRDKISARQLAPGLSIEELAKVFSGINELMNDFKRMFKKNTLLTYMNIHSKELEEITSTNSDAFFQSYVYEQTVPMGYMRWVEKN